MLCAPFYTILCTCLVKTLYGINYNNNKSNSLIAHSLGTGENHLVVILLIMENPTVSVSTTYITITPILICFQNDVKLVSWPNWTTCHAIESTKYAY